jgi:hypothetical protein
MPAMQLDHVWSVLCKHSAIDPRTRNISLYEVIEVIRVDWRSSSAAVLTSMEVVSLWTRDSINTPARGQARIFLTSPSGTESLHQIQDIDLRQYRRVRVRYVITAVEFEGPGTYHFNVQWRANENDVWHPTARIPFDIVQPEIP